MIYILYLLKGVFPLNGNHNRPLSRFGCQWTVVQTKIGESPNHFRVLYYVGFFPHKYYVTRSVKLLVLNIPEASCDRNINKHNRKADKLSVKLSFSR